MWLQNVWFKRTVEAKERSEKFVNFMRHYQLLFFLLTEPTLCEVALNDNGRDVSDLLERMSSVIFQFYQWLFL